VALVGGLVEGLAVVVHLLLHRLLLRHLLLRHLF
jgi:hypothetical protein